MAYTPPGEDEVADQEGWDSIITSTSSGRLTSKIAYAHMKQYNSKRLVVFDRGVEISFFNDQGQLISVVKGDSALLWQQNENLELFGNVVVNSEEGVDLFSEELKWDDESQLVTAEELVTVITTANDTIHGVGFESNKAFDKWIIKKPWGVTQKKIRFERDED